MTDWTSEEDEAFNDVEKQSNLGKQILRAQGQPYHWAAEATKAAVLIEREECARICDDINAKYKWPEETAERIASQWCADAIRARGQA